MTLKEIVHELSQLNDLKKEVGELDQRLAELEKATRGGRFGEHALKLAEVRGRLERRRTDCANELLKLCRFIDGIEDSRMRRIMSARYVDGLSWQQIAWKIGEYDEQIPRKLHNRFLTNPES